MNVLNKALLQLSFSLYFVPCAFGCCFQQPWKQIARRSVITRFQLTAQFTAWMSIISSRCIRNNSLSSTSDFCLFLDVVLNSRNSLPLLDKFIRLKATSMHPQPQETYQEMAHKIMSLGMLFLLFHQMTPLSPLSHSLLVPAIVLASLRIFSSTVSALFISDPSTVAAIFQ